MLNRLKNHGNRNHRPALLLLALIAIAGLSMTSAATVHASQPQDDLIIHEVTGDSMLVELRAPAPDLNTIQANGQSFDLVSLAEGYQWTEEAGRPLLPVRNAIVGVPDLSTVQIELVSVEESLLPGSFHIYPAPEAASMLDFEPGQRTVDSGDPAAAGTEFRFVYDADFYTQDALYPAQVASVGDKGYMRDQLVVRLSFNPLRVNPARGELWYASSILVRLHFDAPAGRKSTAGEAGQTAQPFDPLASRNNSFDEALFSTLLNYEQALDWRISRSEAAVKLSKRFKSGPTGDSSRYRVEVTEPGLAEIRYSQLAGAGAALDSLNLAGLRLERDGEEIALEIVDGDDGSFDPGDSIRFYAQIEESLYTWRNVYWLILDDQAGRRMESRSVLPVSAGQTPEDFPAHLHFEESVYYQSELPREGFEADRWYWSFTRWRDRGAIISRTISFELPAPSSLPQQVTLRAGLQGASSYFLIDPDHYAKIYINNHLIGESTWDSYEASEEEFQFDGAWLQAGTNSFTLETPGQVGISEDVVFLNWFEIDFRQAYQASQNQLAFSVEGPGPRQVQVDGFTTSDLLLYDVSDPQNLVRLTDFSVTDQGGSYRLSFSDKLLDGRRDYLALAANGSRPVVALSWDAPGNLKNPASGADYLLISYGDFLPAAQALADHRATTGFSPRVIDVQDIYDEFSGGQLSPVAIRDFLAYAYQNWPDPAPAYVLLLGDGTYDFKNYLGYGARIYIPPLLDAVDPFIGETASDNGYVTVVGGDILPDMHIGRLPANTLSEAWNMVNKTINYETNPAPGDWRYDLLFVTDNADTAGDFPYLSNEVADYLIPSPYQVEKVYYGDNYTDVLGARDAVKTGINSGALLVNYVGHASITWWAAEILLSANDVSSLHNGDRLPVMLPMTCYDGYFQSPVFSSMAETIIRGNGRGAVASWSATGQGVASGHDYLHRGFYEAVFYGGVRRLGPATLAGKLKLFSDDTRFRDLIETYGLLGDPGLSLNLPDADLTVEMSVTPAGPIQQGDALTYTIAYENNGMATAPNAVLTTALPSTLLNMTITSTNPAISLRSGDLFIWDLGPLAVGEGGQITVTGRVPDALGVLDAPYSAGSRLLSVWQESDLSNNKGGPLFVPILESDLAVTLEPQAGAANPGGPASLRLSYRNNGPAAATTPHLALPLPLWLDNPSFSYSGPEPVLRPGPSLYWDLPTLAPGESGEIVITGTLAADLSFDMLPLTAEATISTPWIDRTPANDSSQSSSLPVFLRDPYEPDDEASQATVVAPASPSTGHSQSRSDDVDWFRFSAQAGRRYLVQLENLTPGGEALLSLRDASSANLLAQLAGSSLSWTAPASADFTLSLAGTDASVPGFLYDLRISAIPHVLFAPAVVVN